MGFRQEVTAESQGTGYVVKTNDHKVSKMTCHTSKTAKKWNDVAVSTVLHPP